MNDTEASIMYQFSVSKSLRLSDFHPRLSKGSDDLHGNAKRRVLETFRKPNQKLHSSPSQTRRSCSSCLCSLWARSRPPSSASAERRICKELLLIVSGEKNFGKPFLYFFRGFPVDQPYDLRCLPACTKQRKPHFLQWFVVPLSAFFSCPRITPTICS